MLRRRSGSSFERLVRAGSAAGLAASLLLVGCVTRDTYELTRKDAEHAWLLYQSEQRHAQELALANKRMKLQLEETQTAFHDLQDSLTRRERDWRETRDELLRLKIDREQQRRGGSRDRAALGPEGSGTSLSAPRPTQSPPEARRPVPPEELRQRLKIVLEQLQAVLQEF